MHLTDVELEAGLESIRGAPRGQGVVDLIVRRPAIDEREVLPRAELDPTRGLIGADWLRRPTKGPDPTPRRDVQIAIMSSRVAALVAGPVDRWPLSGDQLFVDLDLSEDALPIGTRLSVGTAVIEISPHPHRGCAKFAERFGPDAVRFVNSTAGRDLRLRGVNAMVIVAGVVIPGDAIRGIG